MLNSFEKMYLAVAWMGKAQQLATIGHPERNIFICVNKKQSEESEFNFG